MYAVLTLAIMGIVLGVILGLADKFLQVEIDERVKTINDMLPQFNCGACGFPGCMGLAEAIVEETGRVSNCKPIKEDAKEEIYKYMETAEGPNGEKFNIAKVK
ncbi:RnfABCDGE type electron transport complex subunit B [Mycoplasma sp. P36-A1]|uniref:RnfABCDGE type electron transport complex subunit B n=1 Tax=Mycoplasma sp. P36-A1 TaxID=3252900 RepID=UPI003C2FCB68